MDGDSLDPRQHEGADQGQGERLRLSSTWLMPACDRVTGLAQVFRQVPLPLDTHSPRAASMKGRRVMKTSLLRCVNGPQPACLAGVVVYPHSVPSRGTGMAVAGLVVGPVAVVTGRSLVWLRSL